MSPRLEESRVLRRFALGFALTAVAMVGGLLAWNSHVRYRDFEQHQQKLVHSSVDGAAGGIGVFIGELRRSVRLLADKEAARLQRLARNPEDDRLYDALQATVKSHFPESFAFTLANAHGDPYVTDFEGRVEGMCLKDMRQFAAERARSGIYVHPNSQMYHFDIMVDWQRDGGNAGIFFVSFPANLIARILKHSELPGHKLMLLKRDIPGLIEITADGSRIALDREFKLRPEEMRRVAYSAPVDGTLWNLVDVPDAGLFENARRAIRREALFIMLAVLAASVAMTLLVLRYHRSNRNLEYLFTHDAATGFPNRYSLLDRLQRSLHEGRRKKIPCALLLIDIGGFRTATGSFLNQRDHQALIMEVGERIRRTLGVDDVFAHLAGNEFAILQPGADAETARRTASMLLEALKKPLTAAQSVTLPKAGIGIAIFPEHGEDAEALTQHASMALYTAKQNAPCLALYAT
jgi:diguanylate cyclase (GGDEF)-like protein